MMRTFGEERAWQDVVHLTEDVRHLAEDVQHLTHFLLAKSPRRLIAVAGPVLGGRLAPTDPRSRASMAAVPGASSELNEQLDDVELALQATERASSSASAG